MRSRIFVATLAAAALGSLSLVTPADASHSWGKYHWARTANPFTLALGDNTSSAWDPYLARTRIDWSMSSVLDTLVASGGTNGADCRPSLGRVEVCNADYGPNGWLGLAQIWLTGGIHIAQGVAKMNDQYFNLAPYSNSGERLHVMCQEVGHTFGLGHQSVSGASLNTCMDYSSSSEGDVTFSGGTITSALRSTVPNNHDYAQLAKIYQRLDTFTTVGTASSTSSRGAVGEDRSSWGSEVERSGSHSTFVRDLGNGERVVTHVTWAG